MSIRYKSTRSDATFSFEEAVLRGLAPDGGLFVPEFWPPHAEIGPNAHLTEIAQSIIFPFTDGISKSQFRKITENALNFPVVLHSLHENPFDGISVLELFHGPTLSFKDFGARTLARIMAHLSDRPIHILTATSGDTGSAVADGFSGFDNVSVTLLYPKGKISAIQELQLTVERPNVTAIAVDGNFDDCQKLVKNVFTSSEFGDKFSSANSINIGRLLPQMSYYGFAFSEIPDDSIIVVPSGNLGNICAGLMAASVMGKRNFKFVAAHNNNDSFVNFLHGNPYQSSPTKATISNAMDVGNPSNFERLTYIFGEENLRDNISGISVSEDETRNTMREVFESNGYLACPHTAVGLTAAKMLKKDFPDRKIVTLATADPAKFPETVHETTGIYPKHDSLEKLHQAKHKSYRIKPEMNELMQILVP